MILREEEAISIGLIDLIDYLDDLDSGMIEASQWQVSASIVQEPCFVEDTFAALHGNLTCFWFEDSWRYLRKGVKYELKERIVEMMVNSEHIICQLDTFTLGDSFIPPEVWSGQRALR